MTNLTSSSRPVAPDETAEILREMLCEDTGRALCDSGGIPKYDEHGNYVGSQYGYGRAFERNRGRDFLSEPAARVRFRVYTHKDEHSVDIEYTKSVFHHCHNTLTFAEDMDKLYREFSARSDSYYLQDMELFCGGRNLTRYLLWKAGLLAVLSTEAVDDEEPWSGSFQAFMDSDVSDIKELTKLLRESWKELLPESRPGPRQVRDLQEADPGRLSEFEWKLLDGLLRQDGGFGGIYNDGEPLCDNTANHENALSQELQYLYFSSPTGCWVLLQTHNGADTRGGYSRPRAFEADDEFLMANDGTIGLACRRSDIPDGVPEYWSTDDNYHWYPEGACGCGTVQLGNCPVYDLDWSTDELPSELQEIEEAISKSDSQVHEMCRQFPEKEQELFETAFENKMKLEEELNYKKHEWLLDSGIVNGGTIVVDNGRAFIQGIELVAGG